MNHAYASSPYTTDFVTSKDGTTIGYRQMGRGPGLVLVRGSGPWGKPERVAEELPGFFQCAAALRPHLETDGEVDFWAV